MFGSVIVPLDGSLIAERAMVPATALVRATRARLVVVSSAPGPESADHRAVELEQRLTDLDVAPDDVRIETFVDPHELIRKVAEEEPASLVCLASHGRGGLASTLLGSVTKAVLHEVRRPIMVVGPQCETDVDPTAGIALVSVDGSAFSEDVVPFAIEWATGFGMVPWAASVTVPMAAGALPAGGEPSAASAVHSVSDRMVRAGLRARWDVLHGQQPAPALVDRARSLPAAVILMSTHGRSGLAQVALGSVATDVIRTAPCPVVLQRPTFGELPA